MKFSRSIGVRSFLVTAVAMFAVVGIAAAAQQHHVANQAKAKAAFSAKQKKELQKMIVAELKGRTGPAGANGAAGAQGLPGVAGTNGAPGSDGARGATGPAGAPGPTGEAGLDGAMGPTGPAGDPGTPGETGATGATGETGPTGPKGDPGDSASSVAYFAQSVDDNVPLTTFFVGSTTVASKLLPAGSYTLEGFANAVYTTDEANGRAAMYCGVVDENGGSFYGASQAVENAGVFIDPPYQASVNVSFGTAFTLESETMVDLNCTTFYNGDGDNDEIYVPPKGATFTAVPVNEIR